EMQNWRDKAKGRWFYEVPEVRWLASLFFEVVGSASIFFKAPIVSMFWPLSVALNVASTAVFGGRSLDLDASDRLDSFSLRPRVGVLDFDMPPKRAKDEIERLQVLADREIRNFLWRRKIAFQCVGKRIEDDLRSRQKNRHNGGRIRIFWAQLDGT